MEKKKSCNCVSQCPCYPNCDQMMDSGQIPGAIPPEWRRPALQPQPNILQPIPAALQPQPNMPQPIPAAPRPMPGMPQSNMPQTIPSTPQPLPGFNMRTMPMPESDVTIEEENERDWQKLKEMYPDMARVILAEVERLCDSMEYEGSAMFDSMPDKTRVQKMTDSIYDRVKERFEVEETADQDDMLVMNSEERRQRPSRQNWLGDFIQVLLYQEMFQRRCRHRSCRHW